jgi:hypothetical protein
MPTLKTLTQTAMLGSDPESALLSSAAQAALATLGGLQLPYTEPVAPCPPETLPAMPEAASQLFKRVLAGEFEALLPEFLRLAAARGVIVPPESLPALLGLGKKELRPLVLPVIGERGRWLAGFNPSWAYALPENDTDWETGSFEQRQRLIERLRVSDPAKARELVQSTWKQDSPEARAAFLTIFAINLSGADEDFLESASADRRKEIRDTALDLLVCMPDSKLSMRVFTKLNVFLQMKSKLLTKTNLTLDLPDAPGEVSKELGIHNVPTLRKNLGEGANWLAFMLSLVPPSYWTNAWKLTPEKAIEAARKSDWAESLLMGWSLALQRVSDPDWAAAMAETSAKQPKLWKMLAENTASALMRQMSTEKLEALAQSSITLKLNELNDKHPLLDMLEAYRQPWSVKLTRTVFASLRRQAGDYHWLLMRAMPGFALYIPPEMVDELAEGWPQNMRGWEVPVNQLLATLRFRREMIESFGD